MHTRTYTHMYISISIYMYTDRQTDRRTDRQTDRYSMSIAILLVLGNANIAYKSFLFHSNHPQLSSSYTNFNISASFTLE